MAEILAFLKELVPILVPLCTLAVLVLGILQRRGVISKEQAELAKADAEDAKRLLSAMGSGIDLAKTKDPTVGTLVTEHVVEKLDVSDKVKLDDFLKEYNLNK